ncbi:ATP-binding protein [Luedemannella helvata]|uniref:ATP-binding protein n=1 Tax=Luedemannella helvata TaxID=349315 RepID=UPI0031E2D03B
MTVAELESLRRLVRGIGRDAGLSLQRAEELTLAVNEVVTNAIQHATGRADVSISRDDAAQTLVVDVVDDGDGIPASVTGERPEPVAIGGRGLYLVRLLCDRVHIDTGAEGTRVRLVMALG